MIYVNEQYSCLFEYYISDIVDFSSFICHELQKLNNSWLQSTARTIRVDSSQAQRTQTSYTIKLSNNTTKYQVSFHRNSGQENNSGLCGIWGKIWRALGHQEKHKSHTSAGRKFALLEGSSHDLVCTGSIWHLVLEAKLVLLSGFVCVWKEDVAPGTGPGAADPRSSSLDRFEVWDVLE